MIESHAADLAEMVFGNPWSGGVHEAEAAPGAMRARCSASRTGAKKACAIASLAVSRSCGVLAKI